MNMITKISILCNLFEISQVTIGAVSKGSNVFLFEYAEKVNNFHGMCLIFQMTVHFTNLKQSVNQQKCLTIFVKQFSGRNPGLSVVRGPLCSENNQLLASKKFRNFVFMNSPYRMFIKLEDLFSRKHYSGYFYS